MAISGPVVCIWWTLLNLDPSSVRIKDSRLGESLEARDVHLRNQDFAPFCLWRSGGGEVVIEIGAGDRVESYTATAVALRGEERDRLYVRQATLVPAFAEYQAKTSRVIPVIALHRNQPRRKAPPAGSPGEFLLHIHAGLRRELLAVRKEVDEYLATRADSVGDGKVKPGLGLQLRTHCLSFCGVLTAHHTMEDGAFDIFERQSPGLWPALDRLRREHHVVADIIEDLRKLLSDLDSGDAGQIRAELQRLAAELAAHFAYEEEQLIPVLT